MKKLLFTSLILLIGAVLQSCDNEEDDFVNIECRSQIQDPEHLGPTYCHVLDSMDFQLLKLSLYYYLPEERLTDAKALWDSIDATVHHEPLSYQNLRLLLCQGWVGKLYAEDKTKDDYRAESEFSEYTLEACRKLTLSPVEKEKINQESQNGNVWEWPYSNCYSWCRFTLARHTGDFSITADQTLFGLPAGTDLSQHFMVEGENKCLPQGTLQNFNLIFWYDKKEPVLNAREFFARDTWLQEKHVLWMKDIPEEQYEVVNFTIRMPVICEYRTRYFRENLSEVPVEEKVFTYNCSVQFGKMTTFKDDFKTLYGINPYMEWKQYQ